MTKKLSILSIVVVLLLSVCLVGCGDSSLSKSDGIIGTWSLYAWKENGIFQQVSGKKTYAFNEETMTITSKTGKSRTYCYKIVDDKLYYVNAKYELEDLGSINKSQTFKITQLDSEELHLYQDRTPQTTKDRGPIGEYEKMEEELLLKRI